MKFLPGFILALVLMTVFASCMHRRGMDIGMNHRRAPGWHRGGHYNHGTGFHNTPPTYRHNR